VNRDQRAEHAAAERGIMALRRAKEQTTVNEVCGTADRPLEAGVVKLADARDSKSRGVHSP
jgi:hypothetical protein